MVAVALIPPRGLEGFALHSNIHMMLATRKCMGNTDYCDVYEGTKDFKILDNGANEDGKPVADDVLLTHAEFLHANEIVLPDVMENKDRTISAVDRFFENHQQEAKKYQCMAVLHAPTQRQGINVLKSWAENPSITTIGIPRSYVKNTFINGRIELVQDIYERLHNRFQLHLLGSIPDYPSEIRAVTKYAPFVRSMDTSLPFNFTIARLDLSTHLRTKCPRPSDYFVRDYGGLDKALLKANIEIFKQWGKPVDPYTS